MEAAGNPSSARITLVLTSPRVAPGLLTAAAWQSLYDAEVVAASEDHPFAQAVRSSGIAVTVVDADPWSWLSDQAATGVSVAWLVRDDGEPALLRRAAEAVAEEPRPSYLVEVVHGSYDVPGARLIDLVRVMDRLRRQCPWDREQTHRSLVKYLLEEAYETIEAIESGDRAHLREELGDLLLQVAFHSRIAVEDPEDPWSIDDVAGDIVEKLVRRHPHVFADTAAEDAAAVEANWETIKASEKQRTSAVEGIPLAMPALTLADKVLGRAAKVLGAGAPPEDGSELAGRASSDDAAAASDHDRIGDELLSAVRRAREAGVDPEQALRDAVRRLIDDIRAAER